MTMLSQKLLIPNITNKWNVMSLLEIRNKCSHDLLSMFTPTQHFLVCQYAIESSLLRITANVIWSEVGNLMFAIIRRMHVIESSRGSYDY